MGAITEQSKGPPSTRPWERWLVPQSFFPHPLPTSLACLRLSFPLNILSPGKLKCHPTSGSLSPVPHLQNWNGSLSEEGWPFCDLWDPVGEGWWCYPLLQCPGCLKSGSGPSECMAFRPQMLGRACGVGMSGTRPDMQGAITLPSCPSVILEGSLVQHLA